MRKKEKREEREMKERMSICIYSFFLHRSRLDRLSHAKLVTLTIDLVLSFNICWSYFRDQLLLLPSSSSSRASSCSTTVTMDISGSNNSNNNNSDNNTNSNCISVDSQGCFLGPCPINTKQVDLYCQNFEKVVVGLCHRYICD